MEEMSAPADAAAGDKVAGGVTVSLIDPGPQPLDVLAVFTAMGCAGDLAADYVGASVQGSRPQVLVGATAKDASRVAEALRHAGATVSLEPSVLTPPAPRPLRSRLPDVEVVERYLAAYNAGDKDLLVRCLSATAVLSDATGLVLVQGAEAIGERMAQIFRHYPDRKVTVLGRLVAGPWVVEHHNTSFNAGATEETTLCFLVAGGLIERLVLLR